MEGGSDALAVAPWTQLDAVDQGAEHFGRLGPDGGIVQRRFELLDFLGVNLG